MSRYTSPSGPEAEFQPGSRRRVLRNLPGVQTKTEIDHLELAALIETQEDYYRKPGLEAMPVTADLIRAMHRDWLRGIYSWAGEYRTVDVSKGDFVWPPAYLVARNMEKLEADVLSDRTPCRHADLSVVCTSLAIVHAELLLIHPFREGNGRLARWLADIMAFQAGYAPPLYRFRGRGSTAVRKNYLSAVVRGYDRDYEPLARFFEEAVRLR